MVLSGGVYGGKGVCLQRRSEITSGSNFRPTAVWGIWGSYYKIPKAIFYLLKGDHTLYPKTYILST